MDPIYWLGFGALVTTILVLDLGVFHRNSRESSTREAAYSTLAYCSLALLFNAWIWWHFGPKPAIDFLTGYLVEWSLSMDNVFVFAVIFNFFRVPMKYQYRVLFWGILAAVVMRLAFILVGAALIEKFHWILYVLGAFLIYTGINLAIHDDDIDPEQSFVLRMMRRWFPVSTGDHGDRFVVVENGKRCITPLFLVMMVVNTTDFAFALDSVPAIFVITQDPFIVFTSNIFAILGLRALYFLLAGFMGMFQYLKYGLSAILIFVGLKMLGDLVNIHIGPMLSLVIIVGLLVVSILASIYGPKPPQKGASKNNHEKPEAIPSNTTPSETVE